MPNARWQIRQGEGCANADLLYSSTTWLSSGFIAARPRTNTSGSGPFITVVKRGILPESA